MIIVPSPGPCGSMTTFHAPLTSIVNGPSTKSPAQPFTDAATLPSGRTNDTITPGQPENVDPDTVSRRVCPTVPLNWNAPFAPGCCAVNERNVLSGIVRSSSLTRYTCTVS